MLYRTTKDLEIKTDTIRLVKCVGNQPAHAVWTTVKKIIDSCGHVPHWKTNSTTEGIQQ